MFFIFVRNTCSLTFFIFISHIRYIYGVNLAITSFNRLVTIITEERLFTTSINLLHTGQANSISPVWILICNFKWPLFLHNFCVKPYVPREPRRDPSNRRLNEHGIYIRHCQESNSQPVPYQAGADPTRPQWRTQFWGTLFERVVTKLTIQRFKRLSFNPYLGVQVVR